MKPICFYLPQYHPIPENNCWWGDGFTEWTNVRKAQPRFPGHYQPRIPGELGYYDLRQPRTRDEQAALAKQYGIYGFCYYHYWFNGKRLLEQPFDEVLTSGSPDFPFCLCWANENWTRRWDGGDSQILMAQTYGPDDDRRLIHSLIPAFRDERYIRVDNRPLFIVYNTDLLPEPQRTADIWRSEVRNAGLGDLFLVRIEKNLPINEPSPLSIGFDAAIEFAPHWGNIQQASQCPERDTLFQADPDFKFFDYEECLYRMLGRSKPSYPLYRGVFPSWDNSARRLSGPTVFTGTSPEKYAFWLSLVALYTHRHFPEKEQFIFINAWNEWAEGCYLEPDEKYGLAYLEATRNALNLAAEFFSLHASFAVDSGEGRFPFDRWYESMSENRSNGSQYVLTEKRTVEKFFNFLDYQMPADLNRNLKEVFEAEVALKNLEISQIKKTLSWKLTKPLRFIGEKLLSLKD